MNHERIHRIYREEALPAWARPRRRRLKLDPRWNPARTGVLTSPPGQPMDRGLGESFNGKLPDKCPNLKWFESLAAVQRIIGRRRGERSDTRSHLGLRERAPVVPAIPHARTKRRRSRPRISSSGAGHEGAPARPTRQGLRTPCLLRQDLPAWNRPPTVSEDDSQVPNPLPRISGRDSGEGNPLPGSSEARLAAPNPLLRISGRDFPERNPAV